MDETNSRIKQQLGVLLPKAEHTKYMIHAINMGTNLTEWVKEALKNQYIIDKEIKPDK